MNASKRAAKLITNINEYNIRILLLLKSETLEMSDEIPYDLPVETYARTTKKKKREEITSRIYIIHT